MQIRVYEFMKLLILRKEIYDYQIENDVTRTCCTQASVEILNDGSIINESIICMCDIKG